MANDHDHGSILALDVSLHLIRAALLEPVDGAYRLVGWSDARREAERALLPQVAETVQHMGDRLGRRLWQPGVAPVADKITPAPPGQGAPLLESDDDLRTPPLGQVAVVASLRPPLRVVAVALTRSSADAVRRAAQSSPADVVDAIGLSAETRISDLAATLVADRADVVVVAGGYDAGVGEPASASSTGMGGDSASDPLLESSARPLLLCDTLRRALERLSPGQRPVLIYAGSHRYAEQGTALLRQAGDGVRVEQVGNVQPGVGLLQTVPLAAALTRAHWHANRRHPAFDTLQTWTTPPGQGTEGGLIGHGQGFAGVVQAWRARENLAELHALHAAPDRWLHVLATGAEASGLEADRSETSGAAGVRLVYTPPGERPAATLGWPPLRLVSGPWPEALWPPPGRGWWDRSGLLPMMAAVAQTSPHAAMSVLSRDLLRLRRP